LNIPDAIRQFREPHYISLSNIIKLMDPLEARDRLEQNDATVAMLNFWHPPIGPGGAAIIAQALRDNTVLTHLYLNGNMIGVEGALAIADALRTNTVLTHLYLGDGNAIRDEGAIAIADALGDNPRSALTELDLGENLIEFDGASAMADILERNVPLTTLYLNDNTIEEAGAQVIAKALLSNVVLTSLSLRNCNIGNGGAVHIARALRRNVTLRRLDLADNQIGQEGVDEILGALQTRPADAPLVLVL
jgi:Ran GTPase-activating protein (RanGAP) involved in mRNA processing and transport